MRCGALTIGACDVDAFYSLVWITQNFQQPNGVVQSRFVGRRSYPMKHGELGKKKVQCLLIRHDPNY